MTHQVKVLDSLSVQMQPLRLEFAKTKKKLDSAHEQLAEVTQARDKGEDSVEICLENQVIKKRKMNKHFFES